MKSDQFSKHIVVIFHNIGGYHVARLQAAHTACQQAGWNLTAVQVVEKTNEHPWGAIEQEITFPLKTLIPFQQNSHQSDCRPDSRAAVSPLTHCLNNIKPDVLVIPGWGFPVSRAALSWSKRHQIPAILMSESKSDDEPRAWWKEWLKSRLYVRKYNAALVGGNQHKEYLAQLGVPVDQIFLGYDVVDNSYFTQAAQIARQDPSAARHRQPKIPSKPYFLAVTRLIPRKNVVSLLEAYSAYRQQVGEQAWDLVVCGSGTEEFSIRQLIQNDQLEAFVHLPGFITYQQIGDWYGLAAAFIHPALQEQWGLVVNEACASGLPILCSHTVGACYELVHNMRNGLTFDPTSAQAIAQSLLKMHSFRPTQRANMGQSSQQIVAQYSPQHFADGLIKAVEWIL